MGTSLRPCYTRSLDCCVNIIPPTEQHQYPSAIPLLNPTQDPPVEAPPTSAEIRQMQAKLDGMKKQRATHKRSLRRAGAGGGGDDDGGGNSSDGSGKTPDDTSPKWPFGMPTPSGFPRLPPFGGMERKTHTTPAEATSVKILSEALSHISCPDKIIKDLISEGTLGSAAQFKYADPYKIHGASVFVRCLQDLLPHNLELAAPAAHQLKEVLAHNIRILFSRRYPTAVDALDFDRAAVLVAALEDCTAKRIPVEDIYDVVSVRASEKPRTVWTKLLQILLVTGHFTELEFEHIRHLLEESTASEHSKLRGFCTCINEHIETPEVSRQGSFFLFCNRELQRAVREAGLQFLQDKRTEGYRAGRERDQRRNVPTNYNANYGANRGKQDNRGWNSNYGNASRTTEKWTKKTTNHTGGGEKDDSNYTTAQVKAWNARRDAQRLVDKANAAASSSSKS